ncbi:hypothetical protein SAMN05421876_101277 [Kaistella jeonii]|nr:hypothetical protein SAMN05421876_101277 [Kaistella jeonii]VEI94870.1 Uncharacterised protein [Kaistella jeonii]
MALARFLSFNKELASTKTYLYNLIFEVDKIKD